MTSAEMLAALGGRVLHSEQGESELYVRVAAADWFDAGRICHDDLGLVYFSFLSAMDWLINTELDAEKVFAADRTIDDDVEPQIITDEVVRRAGGTARFQLMARVANPETGDAVMLHADLGSGRSESAEDLHVQSWVPIYRGADWHERETWEMFGITFDGHPSLRHMYLPEGFEGFPLRKDFALLARQVRPWPGLVDMEEMPTVEEPNTEEPTL